jgi:hypothetical protein
MSSNAAPLIAPPPVEVRLHPASSLGEALIWYHFVPLLGDEGRRWFAEYQDSGAEAQAQRIDFAVHLVRKGRRFEAAAELAACRRWQLRAGRGVAPAIHGVLETGYHAARAYGQYLDGRLDRARTSMLRAHTALASTLDRAPHLLPFAQKAIQLTLNEARIEATERRWDAMWGLVDRARAMARGERPFCVGPQGPVTIQAIRAALSAIEPVGDHDAEALAILLDGTRYVETTEAMVSSATTPPHMAPLDCF